MDKRTSTSIKGTNFTNSGLEIHIDPTRIVFPQDFRGVIFSTEMARECLDIARYGIIDIDTLILNPDVNFPSYAIYEAIKKSLPALNADISTSKYEEYENIINKGLEEDEKRSRILVKFFQELNKGFNTADKIKLFQGLVQNKSYKDADFSFIPTEVK